MSCRMKVGRARGVAIICKHDFILLLMFSKELLSMSLAANNLICRCFYTENYFVKHLKLHISFYGRSQFMQSYGHVSYTNRHFQFMELFVRATCARSVSRTLRTSCFCPVNTTSAVGVVGVRTPQKFKLGCPTPKKLMGNITCRPITSLV